MGEAEDTIDTEDTSTDAVEEEIVLGEETQSPLPDGALRTITKLRTDRREAREALTERDDEVQRLRRENELLQMNVRPKRSDFDDPDEYESKLDEYRERKIEQTVQNTVQQLAPQEPDNRLEEAVEAHDAKASKLKVSDYDETQDKAIEILGPMLSREIITQMDKSHLVMYHLGKNPAKAREIQSLLEQNPVKATLALGQLEAELRVRPKKPAQIEPETPVEGGTPPAPTTDAIDKMRDKVAAESDPAKQRALMTQLREMKKAAREA